MWNFGVERSLSQVASTRSALSRIHNFSVVSERLPALFTVLTAVRPGVRTNMVSIRNIGEVTIVGTAGTRDDLLGYEKSLRDANVFQELNSPISNILREINISFTFEGKLREQHKF